MLFLGLRRIVLDILVPIKGIGIEKLAQKIEEVEGVEGVNITVKEFDVQTQTIVMVIEGENINFEEVEKLLEMYGVAIHGIDQVIAGKKTVELPSYFIEF